MADEYYLQDTRCVVGNSMMWWQKGGNGYTCDIKKAEVYSREEAFKKHANRSSDRPWPKAYIDLRLQHHVDVQSCDYAEAIN